MPEENNPPPVSPTSNSSEETQLNPKNSTVGAFLNSILNAENMFKSNPGIQGKPAESMFQNALDTLTQEVAKQQEKIGEQQKKIEAQQKIIEAQQKITNKHQDVIKSLMARTKRAVRDLGETRTLVFFGFIVLLVMVAGMLWTAWNERNNKFDTLQEKVYAYQEKIDSLQTQIDHNIVAPPIQSSQKAKK